MRAVGAGGVGGGFEPLEGGGDQEGLFGPAQVGDDEVDLLGRGEVERVGAFDEDDARVVAEFPGKLAVGGVDGVDLGCPALEQAVGEPAGGGAQVSAQVRSAGLKEKAARAWASLRPPRETKGEDDMGSRHAERGKEKWRQQARVGGSCGRYGLSCGVLGSSCHSGDGNRWSLAQGGSPVLRTCEDQLGFGEAVFEAEALGGGDADDGDAQLVSQADHVVLVEHDDIARGQGEAAAAVGLEVFDGVDAHGGNVGTPVMAHARALDQGPALGAAELADAVDHAVGAFDGLDGDDIPLANGDGLANVQAENLGEEGPDKVDVGLLLGRRLTLGHYACVGKFVRDWGGGVQQSDAAAVELVSDGGQNGVGAPVAAQVLVPGADGGEVRDIPEYPPGIVHQLGLVDLADHDGVVDAQLGEDLAPAPDPEETDLPEGGAEGGELDVVLIGEAQAMDGVAGGAQGTRDEQGEAATTGDEADGSGGRGRVREDRER